MGYKRDWLRSTQLSSADEITSRVEDVSKWLYVMGFPSMCDALKDIFEENKYVLQISRTRFGIFSG